MPKVRYFEGEKGIIEAFNHSLFAEGVEEILFCTSYAFLRTPGIRRNDLHFYIPLRLKKGIRMRVLSDASPVAREFMRSSKKQMRQHRFLRAGVTLPGNFHIYGNYVAYFSNGQQETFAMICESESMASTLRLLFELLWQQTKGDAENRLSAQYVNSSSSRKKRFTSASAASGVSDA